MKLSINKELSTLGKVCLKLDEAALDEIVFSYDILIINKVEVNVEYKVLGFLLVISQ
jgi:hypothetical protein